MTDRPDELREHVEVLSAFEPDYREYVDAQKCADAGYSIDAAWVGARRSVLFAAPRAPSATWKLLCQAARAETVARGGRSSSRSFVRWGAAS
jgi:hypothetical protein